MRSFWFLAIFTTVIFNDLSIFIFGAAISLSNRNSFFEDETKSNCNVSLEGPKAITCTNVKKLTTDYMDYANSWGVQKLSIVNSKRLEVDFESVFIPYYRNRVMVPTVSITNVTDLKLSLNMIPSDNLLITNSNVRFTRFAFVSFHSISVTQCGLKQIPDLFALKMNDLKNLNLSHNALTEINVNSYVRNSLRSVTPSYVLDLSNNNISGIVSGNATDLDSYLCISVSKLYLNNNPLGKINLNEMKLCDTLEYLDVRNVSLQDISDNFSLGKHKVKFIDLSGNDLKRLDGLIFFQRKEIAVLNLTSCNISFIANEFFTGLENLSRFNLNNNLLEDVSLPLRNLTSLDLSGNKITRIGDNLIADGKKLEILNLSNNKISTLSNFTLQRFPLLKIFSLAGNKINYLELTVTFNDSLEILDLSNNQIAKFKLELGPYLRNQHLNGNNTKQMEPNWGTGLPNFLTVNLSRNNLTKISRSAFSGIRRVSKLDLSNSNVESLEPGFLNGLLNLWLLNLDNNRIARIQANTFSAEESFLSALFLENSFTEIEPYAFSGLNKLTKLFMAGNVMRRIPEKLLHGLHNLMYLNMVDMGIQEIESGFLNGLENINLLLLEDNNLGRLKANYFIGGKNLLGINLSNNSISAIDRNAFAGLDNLGYLDLTNNKIKFLEANSFFGLKSLPELDLSNQRISNLKRSYFDGLTGLYQLNLTGNAISVVQNGTFKGLKHLGILYLDDNEITDFEDSEFESRVGLEILSLKRNAFSSLNTKMFKVFGTLTELYLSHNNLTVLPQKVFHHLRELRVLEIDNNRLEEIPGRLFEKQKNLEKLNLNSNKFKHFPVGTFGNLNNLTWFSVAENRLKRFPITLLHNSVDLKILDVSYNNLSHFDFEKLHKFLPSVREIFLEGNDLSCHHLIDLFHYFKSADISCMLKYPVYDEENVDGVRCTDVDWNEDDGKYNSSKSVKKITQNIDELLKLVSEKLTGSNEGIINVENHVKIVATSVNVMFCLILLICVSLVCVFMYKKCKSSKSSSIAASSLIELLDRD